MENSKLVEKYVRRVNSDRPDILDPGVLEMLLWKLIEVKCADDPEKWEKVKSSLPKLDSHIEKVLYQGFITLLGGLDQLHADNERIIELLESQKKRDEK